MEIVFDIVIRSGDEVAATLKVNKLAVSVEIPGEGIFTGTRQGNYPYVDWNQEMDESFMDLVSWYFVNKVESSSLRNRK